MQKLVGLSSMLLSVATYDMPSFLATYTCNRFESTILEYMSTLEFKVRVEGKRIIIRAKANTFSLLNYVAS